MRRRRLPAVVLAALGLCSLGMRGAAAHTEPDHVAVPADAPATVTLKPTHGCAGAPTTKVSTRVPVAGATAGEVPGWTATAAPDDAGRTVIEWTGGSLPDDEVGAFPVSFRAPGEVGELLTFPFIQECSNGQELAWIDGNPDGEYPAPRVLILAAGSAPAGTIDDVPADAPGRSQLVEVVDVDDDPDAGSTTTPAEVTTTSARSTTTTTADSAGDDGSALPVVLGVVLLAAAAGGTAALRRRP